MVCDFYDITSASSFHVSSWKDRLKKHTGGKKHQLKVARISTHLNFCPGIEFNLAIYTGEFLPWRKFHFILFFVLVGIMLCWERKYRLKEKNEQEHQ